VKLTVQDKNGNKNEFTKNVYVSDSDTPSAYIDITS